ncbi:hypothetical protein [uncultured Gemmiger sp.]|uniref:hypothetical protein n=1 Tax=uncultured Gemmiger sp. TaxID=1623490 RepID=UPI0025CD3EF6|nr:hypothetical protein [uncultured Gemmiger sp.]
MISWIDWIVFPKSVGCPACGLFCLPIPNVKSQDTQIRYCTNSQNDGEAGERIFVKQQNSVEKQQIDEIDNTGPGVRCNEVICRHIVKNTKERPQFPENA